VHGPDLDPSAPPPLPKAFRGGAPPKAFERRIARRFDTVAGLGALVPDREHLAGLLQLWSVLREPDAG
jgi:hypothetical protein